MARYTFLIVVGICLIMFTLPGYAKSHKDRGDQVCVYTNENFHGHEQCYKPGEEVADLKHADITSVRVYGRARATLYEDRDFGGRMMEFSASVPDLHHLPMSGSKSWNDHVGSLRVSSDYAPAKENVYIFEQPPARVYEVAPGSQVVNEGVCVYERPNFQGRFQCWSADSNVSDLSSASWNDKIESIRVFGHARFVGFKDPGFRGERVVFEHDVPDLRDYGMHGGGDWNHEISSFEIER